MYDESPDATRKASLVPQVAVNKYIHISSLWMPTFLTLGLMLQFIFFYSVISYIHSLDQVNKYIQEAYSYYLKLVLK